MNQAKWQYFVLHFFCSFFFYFITVHSVLFPGGASDLFDSPYERTAKILFNLAVKANKAGDVFPLWGTCLGFEFLSICGAGGEHVLSKVNGENYSVNLNLSVGKWIYSFLIAPVAKIFPFKNVLKYHPGTKPLVWCTGLCELIVVWFLSFSELLFFIVGYQSSRLFGSAPEEIITFLKTKNVTFNNHGLCLSTDVCLLFIFACHIFLSWWERFHSNTIILIHRLIIYYILVKSN